LETLVKEGKLDVVEFASKYENHWVIHEGRRFGRFIKWRDKMRLKSLVSTSALKKIWKFFGSLFTKFKRKNGFIKGEVYPLSGSVPQSEWKRLTLQLKEQLLDKDQITGLLYQQPLVQCSRVPQLKFERWRKPVAERQGNVGKKLRWAIVRRLSRWKSIWLRSSIPPKGSDSAVWLSSEFSEWWFQHGQISSVTINFCQNSISGR
jgi:ssDNA-binding Zn-finger/Zn-ribbon topoisomerase 1